MIPKPTPASLFVLLAGFGALQAYAADTKLPERPTKMVTTACDINEQEITPKGQAVCRYLCRDRDKTKVAVVFSSSGTSQCRTPVERTIKVAIK
jgi:hypothetical protein